MSYCTCVDHPVVDRSEVCDSHCEDCTWDSDYTEDAPGFLYVPEAETAFLQDIGVPMPKAVEIAVLCSSCNSFVELIALETLLLAPSHPELCSKLPVR